MDQIKSVLVEIFEVIVRRDPHTSTPVTVPSYEVTVLKNLFGKEHVSIGDPVHRIEVVPESEYGRLCSKYGSELIAKIFGEDDGARLAELVIDSQVKEDEDKKPKKGAKPSDESDNSKG